MRIISGILGGRHFDAPPGHKSHPMSEKMRGALFNALGDISGMTVLDAFAGSGALSFEALSRGALRVIAIDNDPVAQKFINRNIKSLDVVKKIKLIKATAGAWLGTSKKAYDIVLLDPPYDKLQERLLAKLAERVKIGGVIVLSLPPSSLFKLPDDSFALLASKSYGDGSLAFYRRLKL